MLARYSIALLLTTKNSARFFPPRYPHIAFVDGENAGVSVIEYASVEAGNDPDQLSHGLFAPGSAGGLKGLVISRGGVEATNPPIIEAIGATSRDRILVFMPMSNFQQRNMRVIPAWSMISTSSSPSTPSFFSAMNVLNPTILIAPPMFFQMAHTRSHPIFRAGSGASGKRWAH